MVSYGRPPDINSCTALIFGTSLECMQHIIVWMVTQTEWPFTQRIRWHLLTKWRLL